MKKYIFSVCFLLSALGGYAQQKWTLRQCVNYAVENNIEIKQQSLNMKSAEIDLSTSKNSRLPNLNAEINQDFSFYQTNTNMTTNASSAQLSVSTSTPLFTGFKIPNQIKADEFNLMAATEGLKKAKDNLELQVASLYLDVLFKKEILKVYQEQNAQSTREVERTKLLVESGKVPASQLFDIKSQQAKDELNVVVADNDLSLALLNLAQSLNIQEAESFDIVEPLLTDVIADNLSSILPPSQVYQTALRVRPQIKEGEYKVEGSKKLLKVAQSGYYPSLNFNARYNTSVQRQYGSTNGSFKDQFKDNGSEYFGFTLSIPIFNRFQVRNQVRSARINIENNILTLDNVKLALFKEIQQAYQSAVSAQAKYASSTKAVDAAIESFKYAQERYAIGKSTVFEFNEVQTKLSASKSEQVQAKYDFLFRAKILDFYRGIPIEIQ